MASSPLYQKIAQELANGIATGTYPLGSQIPTEAELCATHDVSRHTAREAVRCLVDRGMISRRARHGSQVISPVPIVGYQPVATDPGDMVALAAGTRIAAGQDSLITADEALTQRIGCDLAAELFLFEGARHLRGRSDRPLCWSEQYIGNDSTAATKDLMVHGTFTAGHAANLRVEQIVMADVLDARLAEQLEAKPDAPALLIIQRFFGQSGGFVAASVQTHPADRYQLRIPVSGTAAFNEAGDANA
jgi:DNA-binding GntR family transcriptional regulator